jgi:hypothetical protein
VEAPRDWGEEEAVEVEVEVAMRAVGQVQKLRPEREDQGRAESAQRSKDGN